MNRTPPPLLGFNNNVRHRGRIFHIQTEDSGVRHARVVTHLFADGGRIVRTTRTDYSGYLGRQDMAARLRRLMKDQHKSMFLALRAGELDAIIDEVFGADASGSEAEGLSAPPRTLPGGATLRAPSMTTPAPVSLDPTEDVTEIHPQKVVAVAAPGRPAAGGATAAAERSQVVPDTAASMTGTRPAVAFAPSTGRDTPSIFGGAAGQESLDEVILSYLAEDIEEESSQE